MKTIITVTICIGALLVGCDANMSPQQRHIWGQAWQKVDENYQRQLDREAYGRPDIILLPPIYPTQRSATYWQERQAKQQYWDNWRRKHNLPQF